MMKTSAAQEKSSHDDRKDSGQNILIGILWMVVTTFLFAAVTGLVRYVGTSLEAPQMAFIRYGFGLLLMLPFMSSLVRIRFSHKDWASFGLRGLFHGLGVILWFYAMARIPVAEVTALGYLVPIFVSLGAVLFLGEVMHWRRGLATLIAFLGALIILRPGFQEIGTGQLAQILAGPLFACSYLLAKRMTVNVNPSLIVGMLSLFCTLVLLPPALMTWKDPTWPDLFLLFLTAVVATSGHYTMTRAIQVAPLTLTQPITFLQLVWASIIGLMIFAEPLDVYVIVGGAIVVGSTTFMAHREAKLAKALKTPPAPATKL